MDCVYCFGFKKYWLGFLLIAATGWACSSSEPVVDEQAGTPPSILQDSTEQQTPVNSSGETADSGQLVEFSYRTGNSTVRIPISPEGQPFHLKLNGKIEPEQSSDTTEWNETVFKERLQRDVRRVLKSFRRAQDLFYREEYKQAMQSVDESLKIMETADGLGLKGTIYFIMGNTNLARQFWLRAVTLDPEIPVPNIPELEEIIEEIKSNEE